MRPIYTSTSDGVERVTDGNTDKAGMAEDVVQVDGDEPCEALDPLRRRVVVNPHQQKFECTGLHISLFGSGAPSAWQELRMIIRIVHGPRTFGNPWLSQRSTGITAFLATLTEIITQSCWLEEIRRQG